MHQNTINQSNPSLQSNYNQSKPLHPLSQHSNGPFVIRNTSNQTVSKFEVSQSCHWTNSQKETYSIFVCYFRQLLQDVNTEKISWNMFKAMSKFLKSRNPQQCRSYHLKLLKQFKGITRFILMVMKRIPKLKERLIQAENQLSQIQIQFNLYTNSSQRQSLCPLSLIRQQNKQQIFSQAQSYGVVEKGDKQQYIKTADSYLQQQNPVKSNNNNYSFFSSRSQFKPFQNFKPKSNRSSLPSFGDDDDHIKPVKQQAKLNYSPINQNQQSNYKNYEFQNKYNPIQQNGNIYSNGFAGIQNENKDMQKMKQFLQCHYLFQLWTSKLQKIMRDS